MVAADETTKVYRATACVESGSVNCAELLLVGAAVVRRWESELTEAKEEKLGLVEKITTESKNVKT
jgi:hypothetical protein